MSRMIRPSTISGEPIEAPIRIASTSTVIVEAWRFIPHEDDLESPQDPWIVVQRDTKRNLIRESTRVFGSKEAAIDAYWSGPMLDFEAWISPLFATGEAA